MMCKIHSETYESNTLSTTTTTKKTITIWNHFDNIAMLQ